MNNYDPTALRQYLGTSGTVGVTNGPAANFTDKISGTAHSSEPAALASILASLNSVGGHYGDRLTDLQNLFASQQ
jgi:hypothetical protein